MTDLILASRSIYRRQLLADAGIAVIAEKPSIDERSVEAPLLRSGAEAEDIALVLAIAKAEDVSERHPSALVIGSDQTLSLDGELFHKPADMAAARHHLLKLSGKTHQLNSAVVILRDGEVVWQHVGIALMTMRTLTPRFIGRFLAETGDKALTSVGAYQIEGPGIRLFEKIDGDHFTIIGMPLLPLLSALRDLGAIDTDG